MDLRGERTSDVISIIEDVLEGEVEIAYDGFLHFGDGDYLDFQDQESDRLLGMEYCRSEGGNHIYEIKTDEEVGLLVELYFNQDEGSELEKIEIIDTEEEVPVEAYMQALEEALEFEDIYLSDAVS